MFSAGDTQSMFTGPRPSKISFWIAGIRAVVNQSGSSLPIENVNQYANLARDQSELISSYVAHTS